MIFLPGDISVTQSGEAAKIVPIRDFLTPLETISSATDISMLGKKN